MSLDIKTGEITLQAVLRTALDGLFVVNRNRQVVFFSEGCERITGTERQVVIGGQCACYHLTGCRDEHGRKLSGVLCPAVKIFNREIPHATQRMQLHHPEGRTVWVETNYTPVYDERGEVSCVVGLMRDVTLTKEKEDGLRARAARPIADTPPDPQPGAAIALEGPRTDPSSVMTEGNEGSLDRILSHLERRHILGALDRAHGQRTLAAKLLGISRSRLYRRMEALSINPRDSLSC